MRAKGLAAAAKKSSRTAAEGLVGVETDFVAKNDIFQVFVREVTAIAPETGDDFVAGANASAIRLGNSW